MRNPTKYELRQQLAIMKVRVERAEMMLDTVQEYAAYYSGTWWQLFDVPTAQPSSFAEWYAQEHSDSFPPAIGPVCEVCHYRAATRVVNLGGETCVQFCEVCRARSPADVVDVWRVKNAPQQQRNSGQEG